MLQAAGGGGCDLFRRMLVVVAAHGGGLARVGNGTGEAWLQRSRCGSRETPWSLNEERSFRAWDVRRLVKDGWTPENRTGMWRRSSRGCRVIGELIDLVLLLVEQ